MARTSDPHAATVKAWQTRARSAGAVGVTQGRGDFARKIADDTRLADGTLADERADGEPPRPGEPFVVYRLGKSTTTELHDNAGNAEGVANHLRNIDKGETEGAGDTVHAFRVVVEDPFGFYEALVGGVQKGWIADGKSGVRPDGSQVGRSGGPRDIVRYSFNGRGGAKFKATLIDSVPLDRVREIMARDPRSTGSTKFGDGEKLREGERRQGGIVEPGEVINLSAGEPIRDETVGAAAIREAFKR